jgi:hypothetical protein
MDGMFFITLDPMLSFLFDLVGTVAGDVLGFFWKSDRIGSVGSSIGESEFEKETSRSYGRWIISISLILSVGYGAWWFWNR